LDTVTKFKVDDCLSTKDQSLEMQKNHTFSARCWPTVWAGWVDRNEFALLNY